MGVVILKEATMKNVISSKAVLIAMSLSVLLPATTAYAQSPSIRVQVPFEFRAGDKILPAGEYSAQAFPGSTLMLLSSVDGSASVYLAAHPVDRDAVREQGVAVFHKYGNAYFLRQVWVGGASVGRELPKTKNERLVARATPPTEVASLRIESR
jgi:hypothetical protein